MTKFTFSFDIGYASIGWSVMEYSEFYMPKVVGTGVVLFESDSCLASKRRSYRRMRRTIRSRRKRIDRIGAILQHHGIITSEQRRGGGHEASFFLAARSLQRKIRLSGVEVWHVLRWYAHNRGYDANSQWSRGDVALLEDSKRVENAKANMKKYGTVTMAETITSILELNTDEITPSFKIDSPKYRNLNLAFPRIVVEDEVRRILSECSEISPHVRDLILDDAKTHKQELEECGVMFPKRYIGSILFGQLLPRFDNRIIARCPITWAETYREALLAGQNESKARKLADKFAKVPNADCTEFYEYRFARILANIRVEGKTLSASQRQELFKLAQEKGRFTKTEFSKAVKSLTEGKENNLKNYFHLLPDSDKALILIPQKDTQRASGRAPYARPILRRVVEEVLQGEDPTRPAYSLQHLEGEAKEKDGVLYCLANPESEVAKIQAGRRIEELTNNHLVRHRMLILSRLLDDMLTKYAGGEATRVTHCCIEVNRDLKEYSGLSAREIATKQSEKMKHFKAAVAYLKKNAPQLPLSAGLIRKCRIAMDMNWTCPYTGTMYSAIDLPKMDREHIVPFANRNTNAMSALVLTYPEVNAMKGKRCALEFIRDFQGKSVAGRDNLSIITESHYKKNVDNLVVKGSKDDCRRQQQRKKLLLLDGVSDNLNEEHLDFTEGQLTQSSQLMKLGALLVKKRIPNSRVLAIPGQVTAAVRGIWKLMGTLAKSTPDIVDSNGKIVDKDTIRKITHMHHAVDACTLGLVLHLIPSGDNGRVWRYLCSRSVSEGELAGIKDILLNSAVGINGSKRLYIGDVPANIKNDMVNALAQHRVVKHVPADMSGAKLSEQYKGIVYENGEPRVQKGRVVLKGKGDKEKTEPISKIVGLKSQKLNAIKAALVVESNYAVALEPEITIVRHVSVYKQLKELRRKNGGKPVKLLRAGNFIKIDNHKDKKRNRVWRITSIKDNAAGIALDLQFPESAVITSATHQTNWLNVSLQGLLKSGLTILDNTYVGLI